MTVYLDESGHETGDYVVIAGFLGSESQWTSFLPEWTDAVGHNSFHMKALRWGRDSTRRRLAKLAPIPYRHGLQAVIGAVRVSDYADLLVNAAETYSVQGYPCALFPIITAVLRATPSKEPIKWVFEQQHDYEQQARAVFRNFPPIYGRNRTAGISFVEKKATPCTQPGDFLAYAVLQKLRDPSSEKARWSQPILEGHTFLGMIVEREMVRGIIGSSLNAAAVLTKLQTGTNPRTAFQRYTNKKEVQEALRRAAEKKRSTTDPIEP